MMALIDFSFIGCIVWLLRTVFLPLYPAWSEIPYDGPHQSPGIDLEVTDASIKLAKCRLTPGLVFGHGCIGHVVIETRYADHFQYIA